MKVLSSIQAKPLGVISAFVMLALCTVTFLLWNTSPMIMGLAIVGAAYHAFLAWSGLTAKWVAIDGDDLLVRNEGSECQRLPLSELESARTWPVFRLIALLRIRHKSGKMISTLVPDQDLTWIMSKMPMSSLSPYWKNRVI